MNIADTNSMDLQEVESETNYKMGYRCKSPVKPFTRADGFNICKKRKKDPKVRPVRAKIHDGKYYYFANY